MGKINSFAEQIQATRSSAGIFPAEGWRQIAISGPDAPGFLHRMLSNEVQKLPIGEGRYNGLLDRKAMTLSLFYLRRTGEQDFLAVIPPQLGDKTLDLLTKMKFIERVALRDVSAERGLLQIIGPKAEAVVKERGLGGDLLIWVEEIFEVPFVSISGPKAKIEEIARNLESNLPVLNENAVRLLKMRSGFPEYGVDLDESHILLEAGLPYFHQRQKGCYPGQEVMERILAYGKGRTPKRLCRLFAKGETPAAKGAEIVTRNGAKAGEVTSSLYDPLENETVVLGYLDNKFADGMDELQLQAGPTLYRPGPVSLPSAS